MPTTNRAFIGIDLGTYNSAACTLVGKEPVLLHPEEGATEQGMCFPSVVEFDDNGDFVHAGELARRSLPVYPTTVVWGVKRLIGRSYEAAESTGDVQRYSYQVDRDNDGGCVIRVGRKVYSPREITAFLLQKIKQDAEAAYNPIGEAVSEAVITVPAYFDPVQKHETEQAALAAGFKRVYLLPEPTAAASAYRLKVEQENQYVVVVDFGAGTLDVTVALLYLDDNGQLQTVEKGHGGDTALGGLDMDDAILESATRRFGLEHVAKDPQARARLRVELENAKIRLSTSDRKTEVAFAWKGGPIKFALSRVDVEEAVGPIIERLCGPIRVALKEADLSVKDISHVLLVGGPTMMPIVRQRIIELFRTNARVVEELEAIDSGGFPIHPMEAVARGAVVGVVGKIAPHGYGVLLEQAYHELLPRKQRYPSRGSFGFAYFGDKRTIDFGLVRQAINPQNYREEYTLLGMFQFDCVPTQGPLQVGMDWVYTDNGVLHFDVSQQGGATMPLYDVSRLDGHRIARPERPTPPLSHEAVWHEAVAPCRPRKPEPWSSAELKQAVRFGQRIVELAQGRANQAPHDQQMKILALCDQLEGWLHDEAADCNYRTPHIRDLGRALLNLFYVTRLIDGSELAALRQDL